MAMKTAEQAFEDWDSGIEDPTGQGAYSGFLAGHAAGAETAFKKWTSNRDWDMLIKSVHQFMRARRRLFMSIWEPATAAATEAELERIVEECERRAEAADFDFGDVAGGASLAMQDLVLWLREPDAPPPGEGKYGDGTGPGECKGCGAIDPFDCVCHGDEAERAEGEAEPTVSTECRLPMKPERAKPVAPVPNLSGQPCKLPPRT